jgi:hypothetical protein
MATSRWRRRKKIVAIVQSVKGLPAGGWVVVAVVRDARLQFMMKESSLLIRPAKGTVRSGRVVGVASW